MNVQTNTTSYFFAEEEVENFEICKELKEWAESNKKNVYVVHSIMGNERYTYDYKDACVILIPGKKIVFFSLNEENEEFDDYVKDFIDDLGSVSDKFGYRDVVGRSRKWGERNYYIKKCCSEISSIETLIPSLETSLSEARNIDLLISLITGSINDSKRIGSGLPETTLDKIKRKIILFDGDQTRFIYEKTPGKDVVRIQGLSGTGKTELLLHKIKDLYVRTDDDRILLTCHNKILAHELKKRLPGFFDFMKVEKQITDRLMCMHSWGSTYDNGTYRYLCNYYDIPFVPYKSGKTFDEICKGALEKITEKMSKTYKDNYAFDWCFVDESQDFGEGFIDLCKAVTKNRVYVAGDVFQSIFDDVSQKSIHPNYLLSKCYRTDPKTLMFAHGLGMGLFEEKRLKWLEDEQWKNCGYEFERSGGNIVLKREPLRRFEDLSDNYESIKLVTNSMINTQKSTRDVIIDEIKKIKAENSTVTPNDICVIFLDDGESTYNTADFLTQDVFDEFEWFGNKAYKTKSTCENSLLISNRNNVKGLEFPFVICQTSSIKNDLKYRNTLYTMMTRSFLQTILIVNNMDSDMENRLRNHLKEIMLSGKMTVKEPSAKEKEQIVIDIQNQKNKKSLKEIFDEECKKLQVTTNERRKLFSLLSYSVEGDSFEEDAVRELISAQYRMIKGRK